MGTSDMGGTQSTKLNNVVIVPSKLKPICRDEDGGGPVLWLKIIALLLPIGALTFTHTQGALCPSLAVEKVKLTPGRYEKVFVLTGFYSDLYVNRELDNQGNILLPKMDLIA
ncbi:hypothetical protein QJS04_geneDACA015627 [Acorus gramineus]|uniref:Uncharacterized protein n=1 Tax=Acorus gramineus TaxID=55184 RepID=A0AAV9ATG2_ACOGR|nr:hypothetical protein QJS04_geneDACA015627 [Acorus gramineus]